METLRWSSPLAELFRAKTSPSSPSQHIISPMIPAQADLIREAIEKANRQIETTLRSGNASAVANLYTDDAQLLPPGGEAVNGSAGIAEFWSLVLGLGVRDISIQTLEVDAQGATAIEVGRFILYADGKVEIDRGKYIVIWKLVKGEWKLHRDIWNSSLPLKK
jgi:uncharacterized protein (TIGR02246 family)